MSEEQTRALALLNTENEELSSALTAKDAEINNLKQSLIVANNTALNAIQDREFEIAELKKQIEGMKNKETCANCGLYGSKESCGIRCDNWQPKKGARGMKVTTTKWAIKIGKKYFALGGTFGSLLNAYLFLSKYGVLSKKETDVKIKETREEIK